MSYMMPEDNKQQFGFIAVIGPPNVGKSTLVNKLVGTKVSIVSPKVQTTRSRVLGITIHDNSQLVFVDTPGIFLPKRNFDKAMVNAAWDGALEGDFIMLMIDASKEDDPRLSHIIKGLKQKKASEPVILLMNKIDKIRPQALLALSQKLNDLYPFHATFMISALKNNGVDDLKSFLAKEVPHGHWMFPEDQISDMPARLLAAEITREQVYLQLNKEIPYAVSIETENWEQFDNGSIRISQIIYVHRDSQKAILLGKGGAQIKKIGEQARIELEKELEETIHLKLFVKVKKNWDEDPDHYTDWGLQFR